MDTDKKAAPKPPPGYEPMETAPRDGGSFPAPAQDGYTHCFWQDGYWWWHNIHSCNDGDYAVGPEPAGWLPEPPQ